MLYQPLKIVSRRGIIATRSSLFLSTTTTARSWNTCSSSSKLTRTMVTITNGVEFDTIAREWRCKWSADNDKQSLQDAQIVLNDTIGTIKSIPGVKDVQRIVCGGCLDFKVITSLPVAEFKEWEAKEFAPESEFLTKLKAIDGITSVETQTYTLMPM